MSIIKAVDYRKKGNHAYLAALTIDKGKVVDRVFYNPTKFMNDRHFAGKSCDCEFDLELLKFSDGYAHLRSGRHADYRSDNSYYLIKNCKVVNQFNSLNELILDACPIEIELPEMKGSTRQVDWADSIRLKCYQSRINADYQNADAKYWIDNFKNIK